MNTNASVTPFGQRVAGILSISSAVIFLAGVALQMQSGWFPEEALSASEMGVWVVSVSGNLRSALLGIAFSCVAIVLWLTVLPNIRRLTAEKQPTLTWLGASAYLAGVVIALAAFVMAFGATWGLMSVPFETSQAASAIWMRSFLVMDDFATFLIGGLGAGLFSIAGWRSGELPKYTCSVGIAAAVLVTIVLLRYSYPIFAFAMIGYPLIMLWFILVGIAFCKRSGGLTQ